MKVMIALFLWIGATAAGAFYAGQWYTTKQLADTCPNCKVETTEVIEPAEETPVHFIGCSPDGEIY